MKKRMGYLHRRPIQKSMKKPYLSIIYKDLNLFEKKKNRAIYHRQLYLPNKKFLAKFVSIYKVFTSFEKDKKRDYLHRPSPL